MKEKDAIKIKYLLSLACVLLVCFFIKIYKLSVLSSIFYIASTAVLLLLVWKKEKVKFSIDSDDVLCSVTVKAFTSGKMNTHTTMLIPFLCYFIVIFLGFTNGTFSQFYLFSCIIMIFCLTLSLFRQNKALFTDTAVTYSNVQITYASIKRYQLIPTKKNKYLLEINNGKHYFSFQLNKNEYEIFNSNVLEKMITASN